MKILLFVCIILSSLSNLKVHAQMLDNSTGEAFTDAPFFNADFIQKNKISRISGSYTHKKVGDIIRESELIHVYEFDKQGRLAMTFETVEAKTGFDTLVTIYEYNTQGLLAALRKSDQYGFYAYHYAYDSIGRITREEFRRNLNKNESRIDFELGKEFTVYYETSSYQNYDGQEKRTFYNSYDQPYRDEITYTDQDGFINEKVDRLQRTSGIKKTTYKYNGNGWLDTLRIESNQAGKISRTYAYEYDDYANLSSKQVFKNGVHQTEFQVIYDRETMLLNYILTREISTNYITILKLDTYEFFDMNKLKLAPPVVQDSNLIKN